jgi:arylsulfatase A-like enzyme
MDALRSDHLGCNGYPRDTSPFIDRLAGEGARFANVVSQASSTFPSVHSALTSKVASHFLDANACLPPRHLTLAECLKNHGYATVGISSSPVVTKSNTAYSLGGFEQGFDVYDESVAYGEAWNWQWRSPEGTVLERRIVQSLDMTPTLLDLADITIPAEMQGESLMPLVQDSESPRREFAVSESPFADLKAVVTGKWKYIYTSGTRPLKPNLRSAQAPGGRLYDLEQDPGELRDVSSEHPEIAAGLHAALLDALPESERERLAAQKDLQIHPDVREQLKSLGYLQ